MVKLNRIALSLFAAALVSLVIGTYLIHPAVAFIVGGIALAAVGVLSLDHEG